MKAQEIRFKNLKNNYSILIGNNILKSLPKQIKRICPKTKKIVLIIDNKIPRRFTIQLKEILKKYDLTILNFVANESKKSFRTVNFFLEKLLSLNLNRSDLIIGMGGGVTGDVTGFIASIFKRGVNFINIPTTLLSQVDASVGGKTGVNSKFGKNLIGSFYQPKLVLADTLFLDSLPRKEITCGYAEVLKHALIKDKKFFYWLAKNTKNIFLKNKKKLIYAIKKSCQIKMYFVEKDVSEKNLRMILNFGHSFAHAIEVKNKFSKKVSHGEAVLSGMILAMRLSVARNILKLNTMKEITKIYEENNLSYTFKKYSKTKKILELISYLKNDKKNDDEKINFILLKKIGQTTLPNKNKISTNSLKTYCKIIAQY